MPKLRHLSFLGFPSKPWALQVSQRNKFGRPFCRWIFKKIVGVIAFSLFSDLFESCFFSSIALTYKTEELARLRPKALPQFPLAEVSLLVLLAFAAAYLARQIVFRTVARTSKAPSKSLLRFEGASEPCSHLTLRLEVPALSIGPCLALDKKIVASSGAMFLPMGSVAVSIVPGDFGGTIHWPRLCLDWATPCRPATPFPAPIPSPAWPTLGRKALDECICSNDVNRCEHAETFICTT